MNAAKKAISRTKKFAADHKVAIAVVITATVTTVVCMKAQKATLNEVSNFLDEKGLAEEFKNHFANV